MAYHSHFFTSALAAAAGDDGNLQEELRQAFCESVTRQLDLIRRSRCDGNWRIATARLHSIAASFHATELMELAENAGNAAPGDPRAILAMESFLGEMRRPA